MSTDIKLTDTQREVIRLATYRPDGNIEPLPPALRGGARKKVIDGLLARDLITSDHAAYFLTDAAYAAVGQASARHLSRLSRRSGQNPRWRPTGPARVRTASRPA